MKKTDTKNTLCIDIGSASVGAALIRREKDDIVLEKVQRKAMTAGSEEARSVLEKRAQEALETLLKDYAGTYNTLYVTVAAPWHTGTIRTIKTKSEKSVLISERTIKQLIEKYKNEKPPESGNQDIEAAALQIRVNDYPTALKEPVQGTDIAINLYESEMSSALHKSFSEAIQKHVRAQKTAFYSFPLASSAALRAISDEPSFVCIHIGGEATELSIVHGDALQYLTSIPIGYWTVLRSAGGESLGDTRSRFALWVKNQLTPEEAGLFEQVFEKAFGPWLSQVENILKEASSLVPIPRTVFVLSDDEPAQWIKRGIEERGTMSLLPTVIAPSTVQPFVVSGEGGLFDVFLSLEAIFFHIAAEEVLGEPIPSKVL